MKYVAELRDPAAMRGLLDRIAHRDGHRIEIGRAVESQDFDGWVIGVGGHGDG